MDVDLGLVRSFLVLVREQDQRRAARALSITASGLSKRVDRLEAQLGVELTLRASEGLRISPAGRRFAPHAASLLQRAEQARSAARGSLGALVLRIGVPAGHTADLTASEAMRRAGHDLRLAHPGLRLTCEEIPFHAVRHCLPDEQVDVLWTCAAVRHAAVESYPLPWTVPRVAVFGGRHRLADAPSVTVADVVEEEVAYSSLVPSEWMEPFWLGDLRSRGSARLVDIDARVYDDVMRHAGGGATVLVMTASDVPHLPPGTRAVRLADAPPVVFHVAARRTDRRPEVRALLALMQRSAAADQDGHHAGALPARAQRLPDHGPEGSLLVHRPHGVPGGG